jgi:hypothetical protein
MASNIVQFLCDLAEASESIFRDEAVEVDSREALKLLSSLGAIEPGPQPETVTCKACDADHPATIEYDTERSCYLHSCPEAGVVTLSDADLTTHRFNPGWLLEWLMTALPIVAPVQRPPLVPNHVWHLGDMACGYTLVTVLFVRRISSLASFDRLASVLHRVHRAERGIAITTSLHCPRQVQLPRGYEFLLLPDIISDLAGSQVLDHTRLASLIAGMPQVTAKGAPTRIGRPTSKDLVAYIYKLRRQGGIPVSSDSAEASAIIAEWRSHAPGQKKPGVSTVRIHLAELRKANQL